MTTVFLSGSRKLSRLNREIRDRLQNIVDKQFSVIIGDANGADKALQKYFSEIHYQNVIVFCSGNSCRTNLGNWNVKHVLVNQNLKGRDFYTQKDKEMAAEADYGFVLWDGKSPGSFNNILELLKKNKKALVYYSPDNEFLLVSKLEDVQILLAKCDQESLNKISKKINLSSSIREIECLAQGSLSF
ncbi:MAG: hypothetical protein K8S15_02390 [Candidatus Aegiribacteria sp.]|nr:hypothetical protein [Candidatus Aegiribacteria sp.]